MHARNGGGEIAPKEGGCSCGLRGGVAPVRRYLPELLDDVLEGRIDPGRVFDYATDLDGVVGAYEAMNERRAVKALLRIGRI